MLFHRRAAIGTAFALAGSGLLHPAPGIGAHPARAQAPSASGGDPVDVRRFGARGDGLAIDSPAINRAIEEVAAAGGGTIHFPAGTYRSFTIRLRSRITLHLAPGAVILAADAPADGQGGYDLAEEQDPRAVGFQDFGHSHWRNSLIWGDGLHDIAITGEGLIWGKGLGRGDGKDNWLQDPTGPGTANKAIALRNCRNVLLRDFRLLEGGWFALLATGVDNLTIDNLLIDTNRDGLDIDCCKNVRVTNCTVNAPYDDAICPKSSFALGYARVTENVTISDCLVTGNYQVGAVLDGSWRRMPADFAPLIHGRIKFGTETNGGFRNITITNCLFEDSRGLALETVDGGVLEDVTISNIAMRGVVHGPFFLRLGKRMRGPAGVPVGSMKRIAISNLVSSGASQLPAVIAGLAERPIEDVMISDTLLHQVGGASAAMAALDPPENELGYPEATMFGDLPATGLFARHVRGLTISNLEVQVAAPDPRPAMWLQDMTGVDLHRLRLPPGDPWQIRRVRGFSAALVRGVADRRID
ncbi:exo-poly-alpha-D-galacturonosidase [Croceibacterium mercuriale]|uniref:Exo-poly-alpha-D-galacturonosidase n=1 Tax=Croceibacterium mercuriale TaxID=1572751 RepID=A0A0B2BZZ3_9SPHN|nr:glycoside hydrolase family 28 protein [Croceibacterium mercuriale]KHL25470.1 exo-poly-alpha-D-galacturonosidase [Croceibacterium mercuriale]